MFYFKEVFFRIFFIFFSFFLLIFLFFNYFELLFWLLNLYFIFSNFQKNKYFIFTHPLEIFNVSINLILFFSFFFIIPFIIWSIFDFFKTALYKKEYVYFKIQLNYVFKYFVFINIISLLFILPTFWLFLNSLNDNILNNILINMELRIEYYLNFLLYYFIISNIFFIILLLIYLFFSNLIFVIKNKNLLILINIFIATIFSPPEVYFQLIIFLFLSFFYEINIFF